MKHVKPLLFMALGITMGLLLALYVLPKEEDGQREQLSRLEVENGKLMEDNGNLDGEIHLLKGQADSLNELIDRGNRTMENLQNELDERINGIDAMSDMELYGFFSRFKTKDTIH